VVVAAGLVEAVASQVAALQEIGNEIIIATRRY
jgi:hypothetical protein